MSGSDLLSRLREVARQLLKHVLLVDLGARLDLTQINQLMQRHPRLLFLDLMQLFLELCLVGGVVMLEVGGVFAVGTVFY